MKGLEVFHVPDDFSILGTNDSNNTYNSSSVTANRDGSIIERTEFIIDVLQGTQFRTERSASGTVEENGIQQFTISLYDLDLGAIASANINITGITNVMSKSTGGGAFSSVGITQPTFAKANGTVSCSYQFLAAEWTVGDIYRLVVEGITATVDTETVYCPTMVWSNAVLESANIDTNVETILSELAGAAGVASFPGAADIGDGVSFAEAIRAILTSIVGGDDYDGFTNISNSANASLDAIAQKFAAAIGIDAANTFDPAMFGGSQTTVEAAFSAIASKLTTGAAVDQIASTTEDLNQAAATYDLFTGTTQAVVLEKLNCKMPTGAAGGALTSISIQTDDATPGVILSSATGAVANLTSEADLSWTGALLINVGTKIQLTIAGGAHGSAYSVTVVAQYRSVVAGGTLVA